MIRIVKKVIENWIFVEHAFEGVGFGEYKVVLVGADREGIEGKMGIYQLEEDKKKKMVMMMKEVMKKMV